MKYAFIQEHSQNHAVSNLCRVLDVSRSSYYDFINHKESLQEEEDRLLAEWIIEIHAASRKTYGIRRIKQELLEHGVRVSKRRIGRIKREHELFSKAQRRFKATTNSKHSLPVEPNRLNRQFTMEQPDDAYVGDITYIPTDEGWLYLAVWLDLYSRSVVGWSMAEHMKADLVNDALRMACFKRRPQAGLIVHSDRGSQYASASFRQLLDEQHFIQSMSRKGNCWDNAPSESFFHTLKTELIRDQRFATRAQAKQAIFEYIEVFYNRQRRHSTIGYMTPEQFEQEFRMSA